jgi:8-amino-7-oxononanoate synthase
VSHAFHTLESPPDATVKIDGRDFFYFAGCGYLGLQARPETIQAACDAARQFGLHPATSRVGFGAIEPIATVERRTAQFFGCEASLYLPTGYASGIVLLQSIEDRFDAIFLDEFSHYSLQDAARQSGKPIFTFRHGDADDLAEGLRRLTPGRRPLIATDGVFSVRGDIAPLDRYCRVLDNYAGAAMLVDDAHGVGVLGANGRGTLEHFDMFDGNVNTPSGSLFLCATLSKALGGYGGIIPGSLDFIERIKNTSHWCAGTTATPAPVAAASARALELAAAEPQLREKLRENIRRLRSGLRTLGLAVHDAPTPIVYLVTGDAANMQRIAGELFAQGVAIAYKPSYAGVDAGGGLRIAVFATHTPEQIDRLLTELHRAI